MLAAAGLTLAVVLLAAAPAVAQVESAEQLTLKVKKGERDIHRPGDPPTTLIVEVFSEVGTPQPDAEVTLQAPEKGPSVQFAGKRSVTQKADDNGLVTVTGIRGNNIKGSVPIAINAVFEGKRGSLMANHVNQPKPFWTKRNGGIVAGILGTTGIVLWQILKPGPPAATINAPTASATTPQSPIRGVQIRLR